MEAARKLAEWESRRSEVLNFLPQEEIVYNFTLPYSSDIDKEATLFFEQIKDRLGRALLNGDLETDCSIWMTRLLKFIKVYGLRFSKADHIKLIKMMYELVILPEIENDKLLKFSTILLRLVEKIYLISPDELTLEWKPLYGIYQKLFNIPSASFDIKPASFRIRHRMETNKFISHARKISLRAKFSALVICCKTYFPESATREIITEVFANSSTWKCIEKDTMRKLMFFLPVTMPPKTYGIGPGMWFDKLMMYWNGTHNSSIWESNMMSLMSQLAKNNMGNIEWEPHIPMIFTRILRSFDLSVAFKRDLLSHTSIDIKPMAVWIVYATGGNNSTITHLENLLKVVETYMQDANSGEWSKKLREFLMRLMEYFVQRYEKEQHITVHMEYGRWQECHRTWQLRTPESYKLTDEDVNRFVQSIANLVLQSTFSKIGFDYTCATLRLIAHIRPNLIVKPTLEKLWSTSSCVTEPHKYTCAMQCVAALAGPMVKGYINGYTEGPTHIICLLTSTLPGIDPNDLRKTVITLDLITEFVSMVPLVDCSSAARYFDDLTEDEARACSDSALFEEFVLQFFDKAFMLIESSSREQTRLDHRSSDECLSRNESIGEIALGYAAQTILMQSSGPIFMAALHKFYDFIKIKTYETKVAGKAVGVICKAFSMVNTVETLKIFMPILSNSILSHIGPADEIRNDGKLDRQLLFHMQILSFIVVGDGKHLVHFVSNIKAIIDKTLKLKSESGYILANQTLLRILQQLTSVYPLEYRSHPDSYDCGLDNFFPIREWGKSFNFLNANLKWHLPNGEEFKCAESLVDFYLSEALLALDSFSNLAKDEVHQCLSTVQAVLNANHLFPVEENALNLADSTLGLEAFMLNIGDEYEIQFHGRNVRDVMASRLKQIQNQMLESRQDDVKNLCFLVEIWKTLAWPAGRSSSGLKSIVGNEPIRMILIQRSYLQHELRAEVRNTAGIGKTNVTILKNLLQLACNKDSKVRFEAKTMIHWILSLYPYSYNAILKDVVDLLKSDPLTEQEKVMGALNVLCGPKSNPLVARQDLRIITKVWLGLIALKPTSDPNIIKLIETIVASVQYHFASINLFPEIPNSCIEAAKALTNISHKEAEKIEVNGHLTIKLHVDRNLSLYKCIIDACVDLLYLDRPVCNRKIIWILLEKLIHEDIPLPKQIVRLALLALTSDYLYERRAAVQIIISVLGKLPPIAHKENSQLDPVIVYETKYLTNWLLFDVKDFKCENMTIDIDKEANHLNGNKTEIQLKMDTPPEEMDAISREIYIFFMDAENVDKIIEMQTLDERKFDPCVHVMCEALFMIYGDALLPNFMRNLQRLLADNQEWSHCCASEIVCGILRGSIFWPIDKVSRLWVDLNPVLTQAVNKSSDKIMYWIRVFKSARSCIGSCHLQHLNKIMNDVIPDFADNPDSFFVLKNDFTHRICSKVSFLNGISNTEDWKTTEFKTTQLKKLDALGFLHHPAENVREQIGSFLSSFFEYDFDFLNCQTTSKPSMCNFITEIQLRFQDLFRENGDGATFTNYQGYCFMDSVSDDDAISCIGNEVQILKITDSDKMLTSNSDVAQRLFKTVMVLLNTSMACSMVAARPCYYVPFVSACAFSTHWGISSTAATVPKDDDMAKLCDQYLNLLSKTMHRPAILSIAIEKAKKVSCSESWWSRRACIAFLQALVFHNLPLISSDAAMMQSIQDIVMNLLSDLTVEVREDAGVLLNGLLHCQVIADENKLKEDFEKRLLKASQLDSIWDKQKLAEVHSCILGLCAYIASQPYSTPNGLSQIFGILSNHVNSPQCIQNTIRTTFTNFIRTHRDNRESTDPYFSVDDLQILSDLVVPLCYA